ncbi:MFS transporter [Trebonia kvetii]|uniref:MFS transporter n=1 Tax=Trebonia kvetii TaxID=2480626 RepID=A0A6P2C2D2_9ACTN|nr:MFS transporter [Trebonia kvetii]TVZ04441.1 MFS transporter [Trebonia kvetii]
MLPHSCHAIEDQVAALEKAAPTAAPAAPRLNRAFVATLMLSYFGSNVALIAPIQNVLPRMVEAATGSSGKALGLGVVTGIGALAALIVNPVAGHFSDRWVAVDNRSVTVLIGLIAGGLSLELLGLSHSLVAIAVWWTLCQATINIAYSPMSAIVVDHVDRRSWGFVWGLISVAQAVGLIAGFAMVVLAFPGTRGGMTAVTVMYVVCLAPLVYVLYALPRVSYPADPDRPRAGFSAGMAALLSAGQGFGKVWAGKFLVMLAETIALLYLYYYLQDVVHYGNPSQGQLILVLIATLAVIVATVTVGRIADRSPGGYRRYAVLASALMALTGFVLAFGTAWGLVIVCAFALGAGYGAFQSVSQALSIVVLPDPANAGRDLGIINIASAIPAVIGAPVAGLVVSYVGGYRGLFAFAGLLAVAGAAVFARVTTSPDSSAPATPTTAP